METRANYILIGVFTLLGLAGLLGFFLWLARIEVERQYAQYDVLFESVSGLTRAAEVRFNGLPVGQVLDLSLYPQDPNRIRVRIEVDAATPIRTGTVARLESQGVTGVSYVALSGGERGQPLLREASDAEFPDIPAERSAVQQLTAEAPDLLEEAIGLLRELRGFVGPENLTYVENILANLDAASGSLDQALADFSAISESVAQGADQIRLFTARLDGIGDAVETTLATADRTLTSADRAITEAETTLATATEALGSADRAFTAAEGFMGDELSRVTADTRRAIAELERAAATIGDTTDAVGARVLTAADTANARLEQLEATIAGAATAIARAEESFAALGGAADRVGTLAGTDGAALLADARAALAEVRDTLAAIDAAAAEIDRTAEAAGGTLASADQAIRNADAFIAEDLAGATETVRSAVAGIERTVSDTGAAVIDAGSRIGGAADLASARLGALEATLADLDATLESARASFAAVETLAGDVDGLVTGEGRALVLDARASLEALRGGLSSLDSVLTEDVPPILDELSGAARTANRVVAEVGEDVTAAAGRVDPLIARGEEALSAATAVLASAGESLEGIDRAVAAAERAFAAAAETIERDAGPATADIRAAARSIETTLATLSEDLPRVTGDLSAAAASARAAAERIEAAVAASGPEVEEFTRTGLPQFTRFAREAEALVERLDRLTRRIERDPARALFGNKPAEFER